MSICIETSIFSTEIAIWQFFYILETFPTAMLVNNAVSLTRNLRPVVGVHGRKVQGIWIRNHHPSPFDPQTTKGWKAAVKVGNGCDHWQVSVAILAYSNMPKNTTFILTIGSNHPNHQTR